MTLWLIALAMSPLLRASASPLLGTYWTAYGAADLGPSVVDYVSLHEAQFFAAGLATNGTLTGLDRTVVLPFMQHTLSVGVAVSLTIGGWSDSANFSPVMADSGLRSVLLDQINQTIQEFTFSGVQIDWEYPGRAGAPGNAYGPNDTSNLVSFMNQLRQAHPDLRLSLAGSSNGFEGITDYSALAKPLDYLVIMAYDMDQDLEVTAPTAPLNLCNGKANDDSVSAAVALYESHRFATSKLVLGVPTYGLAFTVSQPVRQINGSSLYQQATQQQEVQFSDLIHWNVLANDGITVGSNGTWTRVFDSCTQTPVLFDSTQSLVISYDDAISVRAKAALAAQKGLAGLYFYAASGDFNAILARAAEGGFVSHRTDLLVAVIMGSVSAAVLLIAMFVIARWHLAKRKGRSGEKDAANWQPPTLASSKSSLTDMRRGADVVLLEDYYSRPAERDRSIQASGWKGSGNHYRPANLPKGASMSSLW